MKKYCVLYKHYDSSTGSPTGGYISTIEEAIDDKTVDDAALEKACNMGWLLLSVREIKN